MKPKYIYYWCGLTFLFEAEYQRLIQNDFFSDIHF